MRALMRILKQSSAHYVYGVFLLVILRTSLSSPPPPPSSAPLFPPAPPFPHSTQAVVYVFRLFLCMGHIPFHEDVPFSSTHISFDTFTHPCCFFAPPPPPTPSRCVALVASS